MTSLPQPNFEVGVLLTKIPYEKRQLDLTNLVAPRSYIHPHVARHALYQV